MELIASLRAQVDRLCAEVSTHPNWMLQQLSTGLRERYGRQYVGFVRRGEDPSRVELLGLCNLEGELVVELGENFEHTKAPLSARLGNDAGTEYWFDAGEFGAWGNAAVDAHFGEAKSAFIAPWLVDRPGDWLILVMSPIAAPASHREDRGLSVSANLLATNLLRALDARRLEHANAWIEREMEEIAKLQQLLRPDPDVSIEGVDVAYSSHIYQYAGGDYLDIPRLSHLVPAEQRCPHADHWGAIIADVSGHGPSAAVEAAMLDAILRTYPEPVDAGPASVMGYVNKHLFTRKPRATFVSAFICNYNPEPRRLRYACAGHPPPLVRHADGSVEVLDVPADIPLRVERDYGWAEGERIMARGETLLMYTDGVTEARDAGDQELGMDGVAKLLEKAEGDAAAVLATMQAGLQAHRGGREPRDDETLIAIQFR